MKPKRQTITEQIRKAIRQSGMTRYRISQETGINQGTLSRFMSGEVKAMKSDTLDRLADLLDLEIVTRNGKPKGK